MDLSVNCYLWEKDVLDFLACNFWNCTKYFIQPMYFVGFYSGDLQALIFWESHFIKQSLVFIWHKIGLQCILPTDFKAYTNTLRKKVVFDSRTLGISPWECNFKENSGSPGVSAHAVISLGRNVSSWGVMFAPVGVLAGDPSPAGQRWPSQQTRLLLWEGEPEAGSASEGSLPAGRENIAVVKCAVCSGCIHVLLRCRCLEVAFSHSHGNFGCPKYLGDIKASPQDSVALLLSKLE